MSILKDLDPQYAKLHSEPSPRKPAIWAGVALLTLGSAYWAATQSTTRATPSEAKSAQKASEPSSGVPANTGASPDFRLENARKHALPATPSTAQAATIHEEPGKAKTPDQQGAQAPATEKPTRTSLADTEYPRPAQGAPNKASSTPSRNSSPAPKTENAKRKIPSNQTVAKNEKTSGGSGKKSSERDIDIITAIVR